VTYCFGGLRICVNRHVEFTAKNFKSTNMIAVFMSEQDAIELFRQDAALLEPKNDLSGTQPAIDQNLAMIGCDESAVTGTAAPEHRQTEHDRY